MINANIKNKIKSSALELFNTTGYEATSIRDLSAKAGCSLPMMYYYYESKEKLLREIVTVDFVEIMDDIFAKAIKTDNLRQFAVTFGNELLLLPEEKRKAVRIALRLHLGAPKNEELNKAIIGYKYAKESSLRNLLFNTWHADKDIEVKTHLTLSALYDFLIVTMLTGRQVTVKQLESDIRFLL